MILIINATEIHLYNMNKYPFQRSETIELKDIQSLSPVIPLNEQPNEQLGSAGDILISTRSRSQLTFACRERGRLLTELYFTLVKNQFLNIATIGVIQLVNIQQTLREISNRGCVPLAGVD